VTTIETTEVDRRRIFTIMAIVVFAFTLAVPSVLPVLAQSSLDPSDPTTIPKYTSQLVIPPVYVPNSVVKDPVTGRVLQQNYKISMTTSIQQILPAGYSTTHVWGYQGKVRFLDGTVLNSFVNSPASTFDAVRGIPIKVTWTNNINVPQMFAVDPTLHWADPNGMDMPMAPFEPFPPGYPDAQDNVPLVTHLHGGEVQSYYDGGPDAWFTATGAHGPAYSTASPTARNAAVYIYPNKQQAATLWYHDHALGMTRINVMSGLAGFYLLRDPKNLLDKYLTTRFPYGVYDIPLAIQDRTFLSNGDFFFPSDGVNPDVHPYWIPEFFGDTIMVNGVVWPNLNVNRGQYRFRVLDGSNARFYNISFSNGMSFTQIGTDGGYLKSPVKLKTLQIAPGERADILVDFSCLTPGTKVRLLNTANAPFPDGDPVDPDTTGQIMQFTVQGNRGRTPAILPYILNPTLAGYKYPTLPSPTKTRTLTLFEVQGDNGPLEVLLNGQKWDATLTEKPRVGTTEDWVIVNLTMDTHPIHLHLVQFQLVGRVAIDKAAYNDSWIELNNGLAPPFPLNYVPKQLRIAPYVQGSLVGPKPNEKGWKDTIQMNPGEATIIRVRFASQNGSPYPFDATKGPGYVWHCHIIDHEDNEMMRPYIVVK